MTVLVPPASRESRVLVPYAVLRMYLRREPNVRVVEVPALWRAQDLRDVRRIARDGKRALTNRLSDKHVARLVQATALAAGIRGDLPEGERLHRFAGHSLRAGLATAAEAEERFVQRHLGHASAEMTRRYQRRRDRFRINLTQAAGL